MEKIEHLISTVKSAIINQERLSHINVSFKIEDNLVFLKKILHIAEAIESESDVYEITTEPVAETSVYYGDRLATVNLINGEATIDGEFVWQEPNTMPQVSKTQLAKFVPTDPSYEPITDIEVDVTVVKVPTAIQVKPSTDISTRGITLRDVALIGGVVVDARNNYAIVDGTWSWQDGSTKVNSSNGFTAVFTPNNTAKYESLTTQVIVMVM